jgi:enamine deaminase RidA (YjgF/YER057c/UK114 family)
MPIQRVTTDVVTEPAAELWSNCMTVDNIAYISGLTARGMDFDSIEGNDEYAQTKVIFEKFKHLVEAAGGAMSDFVKLTIFVTNIANRKKVWDARAEFFSGDFPACSLVEVSALASEEILVEIEGVAYLGQGPR